MPTIIVDGVAVDATPAVTAALVAETASPVPSTITRRQFLLALLAAGLISGDDALAAATNGALPAPFAAVLADLPAADALAAQITWASMTVAERGSPLIALMIAAGAATDAQVDGLFRAGAAL